MEASSLTMTPTGIEFKEVPVNLSITNKAKDKAKDFFGMKSN